ncbi:ATP-binding response regulator [Halovivax limisalsi]|uniref:ATP-binding response regulator n=1 Tax=Halovivax limisalsi TaxID=1453760 RepID=UPI001FFCC08C|nr:GAF domain-containing sensor histidine kinase [Halovivax limisalsi]
MHETIRILYVDDDPDSGHRTATLERADDRFSVESAEGVENARTHLERAAFDCVVSTTRLPDGGDLDLLRAIRRGDDRLPFILVVGRAGEDVASEAIAAGATDYLREGTDGNATERLADRIETAVVGRRDRDRHLARQNEKIEALHAVATDIDSCETPESVYETVVDAAESILEFDIAIADAREGDELVPQAISTHLSAEQYYDTTPVDAEDNLAAEAFRTGEASLVDDLHAEGAAPADSAFRSALSVPIGAYGVFQTVTKDPGAFDERDLELVELLLSHAIEQLARIENEHELRARTEALRERTDELERKNDRLNEFATVISHDLRNPLTVAKGQLDLLSADCESEHVAEIESALDRMDALMENLLTLAREGNSVDELRAVDLETAGRQAWGTVDTDDATLSVETDRVVRADEVRLRQLLENLVRNAIEHGGAEVTVTIGDRDGGFYVADDGDGIPPAERDQIFESGFTTSDGGTGFGLAIVSEIAAAHGWDESVTESEGGGARFDLTGVDVIE